MYLLGYDIGSSSVKASIVDACSGLCVASDFFPKTEAPIISKKAGWAEQDPNMWWESLKQATKSVLESAKKSVKLSSYEIKGIGISYQMHGLVCLDKAKNVLRPAIIWCDSRATSYGNKAFASIGERKCLEHLLNSPGNFTAAKLAWVKENEPRIFEQIYKIMLPGDWIALKLTDRAATTVSGLSEAMLWDFKEDAPARFMMDWFGFDSEIIPEILPTFSEQGRVSAAAAEELGLCPGTPVSYRAGDQPNNALSLNVLEPGEIASTAGTSGVVYGVRGSIGYDKESRVNTFAHVNHTAECARLGVLLCINGTGILNSWVKHNMSVPGTGYEELNELAAGIPIGSDGICVLPFGNGSERMLGNRTCGCNFCGLNFNIHGRNHIFRAVQEGIVFSFKYGIEIMESLEIPIKKIHAGKANMFLSPIFREALACITGATIELFDTDGSIGAAKGAGIGMGFYKNNDEAFSNLKILLSANPNPKLVPAYLEAYENWKKNLNKLY